MALPYQAAPSHATPDRTHSHVPASDDHHAPVVRGVPDPIATPAARAAARADLPWYRREQWLVMSIVAFLPVCFAVVAPSAWRVPLVALTGVLMLAALAMMLRRDRAVRAEEERVRSPSRSA